MKLTISALAILVAASGCANDDATTHPHATLPPGSVLPTTHQLPAGLTTMQLFGGAGAWSFSGPTAAGGATYTNATVADPSDDMPPNPGTGTVDVTIAGTEYQSSEFQTIAFVGQDDTGTSYAVVDGYYLYTGSDGGDLATEVTVIVKASDFALGTPIALDGDDRVALFANGDPNADGPSLEGAAISGTVTFTAGSLDSGSTVSATITGQFGPITSIPRGDDGSGSDGPPSALDAGTYALAIDGTSQVYCQGALVGHEADFAGITQTQLGFASGPIDLTALGTSWTASGAPINAAFGEPSLELDPQPGEQALFAGFTEDGTTPGPDGTTQIGGYFALDGSTATPVLVEGSIGEGYVSSDGTSSCTVAFDTTLTSP